MPGQLKTTKGCSLFALNTQVIDEIGDADPASLRNLFRDPVLACVVKKKLLLFCWDPVATTFVEHKELPMPEVPLAIQWCGDSGNIVVGFRREYSLLNYRSEQSTELFPTGSGSKGRGGSGGPIAALLPENQVLLGRDMISIFLGFDGKPTRKYGVSWSDLPLAVSHTHPFLIALTSKALEVRSMSRSSGNSRCVCMIICDS
jgi:Vam6/Vps39-like protein vacuolar protein sorting-associated protein 39